MEAPQANSLFSLMILLKNGIFFRIKELQFVP